MIENDITRRVCGERIRLVAVFHLPDVSGPARTFAPRLAYLRDRAEIDMVFPGRDAAAAELGDLGRSVFVPYEALTIPRGVRATGRAAVTVARGIARFREVFVDRRPDVVVVLTATLPHALVAARIEGIPTILYAAELLDRGYGRRAWRAVGGSALVGASARLADTVVACSHTVGEPYRRAGARVRVIYPGIANVPLPIRDRVNGPVVASIGSLTRGRGQDVLLGAVARLRRRLPCVRCVIAGKPHPRRHDEQYAHELEALAVTLGIGESVTFTGFVNDVATVLAQCHVVVNPARFPEPFGRAALEALAAGRPVVATRVGAIPEVLEHETDALLVPPDDEIALADAIERLWRQPEFAADLVERARARISERFDETRGAEEFASVVDDVLSRTGD
jgi:glycosyltransferase involved in cell wall biosynthesis